MPNVTSFNITFRTTSDDKDWNTQARFRVIVGGQDRATLFCCDQNRTIDNWQNNTTTSRLMTIVQTTSKAELQGAVFANAMTAVGNDTWVFIPTLTAKYNDGTSEEWTRPETTLISDNTEASINRSIPPA